MTTFNKQDWVINRLLARRLDESAPSTQSLIKDGATPPEILEQFTVLAKKENLLDDRAEQRDSGSKSE
jgi:hypothetical protein